MVAESHRIQPLVEPVLERLDRHEELLTELKGVLEVQVKRTADVQGARKSEIRKSLCDNS